MLNFDYLNNLNEKQKEAVTRLDGPLLIVAGAGSGKTKVLTSRICHIILSNKASPNEVLAVTFTNKAANEIILKDFYAKNPTKATAVRQLPLLREWQAYPGDKGLAMTQLLYDGIERIVVGDANDMKALQAELTEESTDLLPK